MKTRHKGTPVIVSFGLGGHGIDVAPHPDETLYTHGYHISGYDRPEHFEQAVARGEYEGLDFSGCVFIDKRDVVAKNPALAVSSPICGPHLKPTQVDRFMRTEFVGMIGAANVGNIWGLLCGLSLADQNFGGLDEVGPAVYAAWWRDKGARMGRWQDGRIVWEKPA